MPFYMLRYLIGWYVTLGASSQDPPLQHQWPLRVSLLSTPCSLLQAEDVKGGDEETRGAREIIMEDCSHGPIEAENISENCP